MGRRAQGHRIWWRNGWAYVRFTHQGHEYNESLGTKDPGEASLAAARKHAQIVAGRKVVGARVLARSSLDVLLAEWIAARQGELDDRTVKNMAGYACRYLATFGTLGRMASTEACEQFARERLRSALRSTVKRELSFVRNFFAWCVDVGVLTEAPLVKPLPRKAIGVRTGHQRLAPVEITLAEARAIAARLPEWSKVHSGERWPCRARFIVAWETGLRPKTIATLSVPEHYVRGAAVLQIDPKNDKVRFGRSVPLSEEARAALDSVLPEKGIIFGTREYRIRLKRAAIEVLGERRGRDFAPYDFRHGRVTHLLDSGAPLTGAAFLVGHKQVSTTNRYTHPSERAARAAIDAVSGQLPDTSAHDDQQYTSKEGRTAKMKSPARCVEHEGIGVETSADPIRKAPRSAPGSFVPGQCPEIQDGIAYWRAEELRSQARGSVLRLGGELKSAAAGHLVELLAAQAAVYGGRVPMSPIAQVAP